MSEIIYTLIVTHITIACVTLYLHRSQAHRAVEFNPAIAHMMRFWLWLTTGMVTKEWVAVHRKHHQHSDHEGDPHSPMVFGVWQVLFKGAWLYHAAAQDRAMINSYGVGTPNDWVETNIYSKYPWAGILIMLIINTIIFGPVGLLIWGIQMIWIPFWAAGVINGLAHYWGYRNGTTRDNSRNLLPIGIIVGGECLHNNHHLAPASAKFSIKPWEFDIGWLYIRCLQLLRLAKLRAQ